MIEEERIHIAAAAERHHCARPTRSGDGSGWGARGTQGETIGRDGRRVIETWVRVSDLDDVFRPTAHDEHVRKIRATARPFTVEQKVALRQVFLAHLLECEAKRKRARAGGATR